MKFLVPNYSCLQNPWLGGYPPQIPILSVLNWICWTPPEKKFLGTPLPRTQCILAYFDTHSQIQLQNSSPLIASSFILLCNMHFDINIHKTKILLSTSYWFIFTKSSTLKVFRHANCWLRQWQFDTVQEVEHFQRTWFCENDPVTGGRLYFVLYT